MLLPRHPVAFALPQAVDPLRVGPEALPAQEISDAAVAVTGVSADEHLHVGEEPGLVVGQAGLVAQGGATSRRRHGPPGAQRWGR